MTKPPDILDTLLSEYEVLHGSSKAIIGDAITEIKTLRYQVTGISSTIEAVKTIFIAISEAFGNEYCPPEYLLTVARCERVLRAARIAIKESDPEPR
jgi:hypothetical protein